MIGIPIGLLYANASEWFIHKYVLHGVGKKKSSFWSFHWSEHHRAARKNKFRDPDYERSVFGKHAQGKEALAVVGLMVAHAPLFPFAPYFTATVMYSALNYLHKHKKAHLDPAWAKEHLRHHYDHHMGSEQDANWCVTQPWFDHIMGTRIEYEYDERGRPHVKPAAEPATLEGAAANTQLAGAGKVAA